jgi:hypothetical protein
MHEEVDAGGQGTRFSCLKFGDALAGRERTLVIATGCARCKIREYTPVSH